MWCCLLMRQHLPWFRNGLLWRQAGCPWGDITVWFVLQTRSHRSMLLCPGTDGTEISREFGLGKVFTTAKWKWRISVDLASRSTSTGHVGASENSGSSWISGVWIAVETWVIGMMRGEWALGCELFLFLFFIYLFFCSPHPTPQVKEQASLTHSEKLGPSLND